MCLRKACCLAAAVLFGSSSIVLAQAAKPVSGPASQPSNPLFDEYEARTYKSADGGTLLYRLLKPKDYDAKQAYPLVLLLHGAGERGGDNKAQLKNGVAELFADEKARKNYPCFAVVPQCPVGSTWADWRRTDARDMTAPTKLALEAIQALQKEFNIDAKRLYVGGLSMGGFGTWDIITRYPDLFAAAFPICGFGDLSKAAAAKGITIWAFQGEKDPVVKAEGMVRMVEAVKKAGGSIQYTEYPGVGHNSWVNAFREPKLLEWMFSQKRSEPGTMKQASQPAK
jgi:predicted peptidase